MSNSERINNMIKQQKEQITELTEQLNNSNLSEQERDEINMNIYELKIGIGECEGALIEMAEIDGCEDHFEYFN